MKLYMEFYGHIGSKKGEHQKYDMDNVIIIEEMNLY